MTAVLCVNCGSSSVKVALWRMGSAREERVRVEAREVAQPDPASVSAALRATLTGLCPEDPEPDAVGHRIVHGGPTLTHPVVIDDEVTAALAGAVRFAPLHVPLGLAGIEVASERFPNLPQVACFDTAFHSGLPEHEQRLPLPRALHDAGIRRYGFHGLSCEFVVDTVGPEALGRAVVAHLGSGASMTAVRDGRSVATTMGLTPSGGLVMSARSGDLDPGVLVHLLRHGGHDVESLERLVDLESGLLGLSGSSGDMRELLAAREVGDASAALAVDVFCRRVRRQLAAYAVELGGLDTLVFTGGIGEHAAPVRAEVCAGLEPFGIVIDAGRNARDDTVISAPGAPVTVRVVPTQEDRVIARHTARLVSGTSHL